MLLSFLENNATIRDDENGHLCLKVHFDLDSLNDLKKHYQLETILQLRNLTAECLRDLSQTKEQFIPFSHPDLYFYDCHNKKYTFENTLSTRDELWLKIFDVRNKNYLQMLGETIHQEEYHLCVQLRDSLKFLNSKWLRQKYGNKLTQQDINNIELDIDEFSNQLIAAHVKTCTTRQIDSLLDIGHILQTYDTRECKSHVEEQKCSNGLTSANSAILFSETGIQTDNCLRVDAPVFHPNNQVPTITDLVRVDPWRIYLPGHITIENPDLNQYRENMQQAINTNIHIVDDYGYVVSKHQQQHAGPFLKDKFAEFYRKSEEIAEDLLTSRICSVYSAASLENLKHLIQSKYIKLLIAKHNLDEQIILQKDPSEHYSVKQQITCELCVVNDGLNTLVYDLYKCSLKLQDIPDGFIDQFMFMYNQFVLLKNKFGISFNNILKLLLRHKKYEIADTNNTDTKTVYQTIKKISKAPVVFKLRWLTSDERNLVQQYQRSRKQTASSYMSSLISVSNTIRMDKVASLLEMFKMMQNHDIANYVLTNLDPLLLPNTKDRIQMSIEYLFCLRVFGVDLEHALALCILNGDAKWTNTEKNQARTIVENEITMLDEQIAQYEGVQDKDESLSILLLKLADWRKLYVKLLTRYLIVHDCSSNTDYIKEYIETRKFSKI